MQAQEGLDVLRDLRSPDEEVRRLAVERLTDLAPPPALEALVETLGDPSWRVRKAAIERLSTAPERSQAVAALVEALADGDNPGRRNAALEALTRCGTAALPALVEASFAPDVDVRKQVVDALAGIADEAATQRLVSLLADPDANVRGAAADALGAIGEQSALQPLLRTIAGDEEKLVRLSALRALARLEASVPVAALESALSDPLLRSAAYAVLGTGDDPAAVDVLIKGLGEAARSAREAAMEALVRLAGVGEPGAPERIGARLRERRADLQELLREGEGRLQDAPLRMRMSWVQFFGLLRDSHSVLPLLAAARDEALGEVVLSALADIADEAEAEIVAAWERLPGDDRLLACGVLARSRGAAGEAKLLELLEAPGPEPRAAAARALGERARASALPALVAALARASEEPVEDADEEVEALCRAIVQVAEAETAGARSRTIALLEERVAGGGETFRLATTRIVGLVGRSEDAARLEIMASDASDAVRRSALEAIARLDPTQTEPLRLGLVDEAPGVRTAAADALAGCREEWVLQDLLGLMEDEDERVRIAALQALGTWAKRSGATAESRARVLAALAGGLGRGGSMAMAALDALCRLGGEDCAARAREALAATDPELVQAAVGCIGRHGSDDDLEDLLPLLSNEHWTVRAETARVVAERRLSQALPALRRRLEAEQDDFVRDALLEAIRRLET